MTGLVGHGLLTVQVTPRMEQTKFLTSDKEGAPFLAVELFRGTGMKFDGTGNGGCAAVKGFFSLFQSTLTLMTLSTLLFPSIVAGPVPEWLAAS